MSADVSKFAEKLRVAMAIEIREARERLGWSQSELAEKAGTTQQTIDRIERFQTLHSRALPAVRDALGLSTVPAETFSRSSIAPSQVENAEKRARNYYAHHHAQAGTEWGDLEVFAFVYSEPMPVLTNSPVDYIPRLYPVARVSNAYGVIVLDEDMAPVLRPGDVAIINPNLPPIGDCEILLAREADGYRQAVLRTLAWHDNEHWVTRTHGGAGEEMMAKASWPSAEVVVSKINRHR